MKSFFNFLLISCLILTTIYGYKLQSTKVSWATNCGSSQSFTGSDGVFYHADRGCSAGKTSNYQESREFSNAQVRYTEDTLIYMTERHDDKSFTYEVPLYNAGSYVLILKFSEMYFREPNRRQFNIKFGSKVVVKALDIVQKVGRVTAHDEYIPFEFDSITRQVMFKNQVVADATDISGNLKVKFEQIQGKDNPMVQGIVLFKGKLEETDYDQIENYKKAWDQRERVAKKREEEEKARKEEARYKKRERVKIRNDAFDNEGSDENNEIYDDEIFVKEKSFSDYLFTPIGFTVLCIVLMAAWYIYKFTNKVEKLDLSKELKTTPINEKMQEKKSSSKKKKN